MNFTYSRVLGPKFQTWATKYLILIETYYAEADHAEYETLEDFAVELYLTTKTQ